MSAWVWLAIAGVLEVAWATGLKISNGFTRRDATAITIVLMLASFYCLAQAVRTLPLGIGYAVWTGIGAVGAALAGAWLFSEPLTPPRLFCIGLIVAGIVGLKLTTAAG